MNILLIDDDRDFLYLLSRSISREGIKVHTATNGLRALDALHHHKIDVIISDVVMKETPIMSLTCTLKNLYPETPLILMSGLPQEPTVNNSLILGADAFLPKPIDMNRLMSVLTSYRA